MADMGDKIKIGILGAGSVTEHYHLPVLKALPEVQIEWICDHVEEKARALAKAYSIPRSFTDLEQCPDVCIALVAIPVGYRNAPIQHMIERGWHILCEKPFAMTLSEHDRILAQASAREVHVGVGLMRRYYQAHLLAKRILQDGIFGEVKELAASEGMRMRGTGRQAGWYLSNRAAGGGVLLETGAHVIDQVFNLFEIQRFQILKSRQHRVKEVDFECHITSTISISNQEDIQFTLSLSFLRDLYNGILIRFPKCTLKLGLLPEDPLTLCAMDGAKLAQLQSPGGAGHVYQAFYLEWEDFIRQCSSGRKSAIAADTARLSTAFIEEAYRQASQANSNPVALEAVRP